MRQLALHLACTLLLVGLSPSTAAVSRESADQVRDVTRISSMNMNHSIAISGFEHADSVTHMILWLGRGEDFRSFVTHDVERELYGQTPGAQLLELACTRRLELETKGRRTAADSEQMTVTGVSIGFPLVARVRTADGEIWKLDLTFRYVVSDMDQDNRTERVDFDVRGSATED